MSGAFLLSFALLACMVASHAAAQAETWVLYYKGDLGSAYYDRDSIYRAPDQTVRVWERFVLSEAGKSAYIEKVMKTSDYEQNKGKYDRFASIKRYWQMDCTSKDTSLISSFHYDDSGKHVASKGVVPRWDPPDPGSRTDPLFAYVCPN